MREEDISKSVVSVIDRKVSADGITKEKLTKNIIGKGRNIQLSKSPAKDTIIISLLKSKHFLRDNKGFILPKYYQNYTTMIEEMEVEVGDTVYLYRRPTDEELYRWRDAWADNMDNFLYKKHEVRRVRSFGIKLFHPVFGNYNFPPWIFYLKKKEGEE